MKKDDINIEKEEKQEENIQEKDLDFKGNLKDEIWNFKDKNNGNNLPTKIKNEENKEPEIKSNITEENENDSIRENEEEIAESVENFFQEKDDINSVKDEPMELNNEPDTENIIVTPQNMKIIIILAL